MKTVHKQFHLAYLLCRHPIFCMYAIFARSVLRNQEWFENIKNSFILNTNLRVVIQIVFVYFRLNAAKRDTGKTNITSDENGAVVAKQEQEDAGNVPEQLNASNVSNDSNASTGSVNSRGSQKKKKNKKLVLLDITK